MLISQRLERLAMRHTDSRRTVSLYLLQNPRAVERQTMADVAQATYTSKSTLVRIAKQLGFDGWSDFSRAYLLEVERGQGSEGDVDHNFPFGPEDSVNEAMDSVARLHAQAARQTYQLQDPIEVGRAARMIADADCVYLSGVNNSGLVLRLFHNKLTAAGKRAMMIDNDGPTREFGFVGQGDCLVALSYSGESARRVPMRFLPGIRQRGAKVIALTSEGDSFLRRNADVVLTLLSRESLYNRVSTFSSEASAECLLDMLYAAYFSLDYEGNLAHVTADERDLSRYRQPGGPGDSVLGD